MVMTREEATEIVLLGQYKDCETCSGTGYVYTERQVQMYCDACDGIGLRLRDGWYSAMWTLGLISVPTKESSSDS
jgi:Zn finger protein HypA/HybF involved in hydrogenase expression